ncbi:MAG TPA: 4Fe-4S dicluster domain-containing protein [Syntrophorhabdaceae bacterium]|nr:4Fe-4S dicluster domain-containing protein [Syntrophorhabdaceae bacterium]
MNDLTFLNEIEDKSGQKVSACYQCYKCTTGCPVAGEMDIYPHRIIRHIILGDREKVLASATIWTCLQCTTCSVRCPNDIDIAHVFDTLRKIAVAEHREAERDTWAFYRYFLDSVKKHGRLHELEAIMHYKLAKKDFFSDTKMGLGMLTKGRMGILPHNIKDKKLMKKIFTRTKSGDKGE